MPQLARIFVYPIKSLDGVSVEQAEILPGGAIAQDREFALFDANGKYVNAKRTPEIHRIRAEFDLKARQVMLWVDGEAERQKFHLDGDRCQLERWFSRFFGYPVVMHQNIQIGFPDDRHASGPTVVSTASLQTVADWFKLSLEETRQRFRTNLEIEDAPAFWEDQLFYASGRAMSFQIGAVTFTSSNPCQRCIVPTRHPHTGEPLPQFQKHFSDKRQQTLPTSVVREQFNHFYKLTLNTLVASQEAGKALHLGDAVTLLSP
jgi:uncharacterized protein YcbX